MRPEQKILLSPGEVKIQDPQYAESLAGAEVMLGKFEVGFNYFFSDAPVPGVIILNGIPCIGLPYEEEVRFWDQQEDEGKKLIPRPDIPLLAAKLCLADREGDGFLWDISEDYGVDELKEGAAYEVLDWAATLMAFDWLMRFDFDYAAESMEKITNELLACGDEADPWELFKYGSILSGIWSNGGVVLKDPKFYGRLVRRENLLKNMIRLRNRLQVDRYFQDLETTAAIIYNAVGLEKRYDHNVKLILIAEAVADSLERFSDSGVRVDRERSYRESRVCWWFDQG